MRRVLVWTLIFATQAIAITPTLPATECKPAVERIAEHAAMHEGHDHTMHWFADWGTLRIECGCGCHASLDGLPMQLAPHAPACAPQVFSVSVSFLDELPERKAVPRTFPKDSPPPKRA